MRVLFGASSWPSHWAPMVPLCWALRAAGHEVRVLCAPSDVDGLTRAGLEAVPALESLDVLRFTRWFNVLAARWGDWPYPEPPPHPDTGESGTFDAGAWWRAAMRSGRERLRRSVDAAVGYARDWRPDLVVHDLVCYEAPVVAEAVGVPNVLHLWGPTGAGGRLAALGGGRGSEQFSSATAERNLFELAGPLAGTILGRAGHVLDPCPPVVGPVVLVDRLPIRYVPYNGSGTMPTVLPSRAGRARVCVVWGRSGTASFGATANRLPQVVAAAGALGVEVLLLATRGDVESLGVLPGFVRPLVEVPLHLVLPYCDAVVHYGGAGSTMTSMVAGLPQLALPLVADAAVLSTRFDDAGCGVTIPNHRADAEAVTDALARVLGEPSFAKAAHELAEQAAAMPAPASVVETLGAIA